MEFVNLKENQARKEIHLYDLNIPPLTIAASISEAEQNSIEEFDSNDDMRDKKIYDKNTF